MKQKMTLEGALSLTLHHVDPTRILTMGRIGQFEAMWVGERFNLVHENVLAAMAKIAEIKKAAEANDCALVLRLLEEESVEAGHSYKEVL